MDMLWNIMSALCFMAAGALMWSAWHTVRESKKARKLKGVDFMKSPLFGNGLPMTEEMRADIIVSDDDYVKRKSAERIDS